MLTEDWVLDICLRREKERDGDEEGRRGERKGETVGFFDKRRRNSGRIFRVPFMIRTLKDYIFKG